MASRWSRILRVHEERVAAYRELDESFRVLLLDEQESVFARSVAACTASFQAAASSVSALWREAVDDQEERALLQQWQEAEQRKLAATVALQQLKKRHFVDSVRRDREEERMAEADRRGTNVLHTHAHHLEDVPTTLAEKRQPPYDQVYEREAAKYAREIAELIETINDCLDELREKTGGYD